MSRRTSLDDQLGMTSPITRRDFVNGALVGGGTLLTAGCAPAPGAAESSNAPSGSPWTGYGGVGDYSWSNGNTEAVVKAAHRFRDHEYPDSSAKAIDETVDLVIVGGGFSGMTAAYEFKKRAAAGQSCLLLENHPVLGGEAKQNELEVDGRRLTAPQGSNGALLLKASYVKGSYDGDSYNVYTDYYRELGLPTQLDLEPVSGGAERFDIPNYHFSPMAPASESIYATGYYFRGSGWVKDPAKAKFANTPWPPAVQKEMDDFVNNRRDGVADVRDVDAWLDSITYYDLLDKLGYGAEVRRFIDPYMAVSDFGVCGNAISAFAAKDLGLSGTTSHPKPGDPPNPKYKGAADIGVISFPGGNAAILRMMLARMIPGSIGGDGGIAAVATSPLDFTKLDRPGAPVRLRSAATVINVAHEGDPSKAQHVIVTYVRDGKIRKVRTKSVVMATGGWVNRNIVTDLPEAYATAYGDFYYGPVMVANVALRNWRFFDKLGFINARWFDGLGWQVSVRRNVAFASDKPLTPDDPIILTFYIPFLNPNLPASAQGPAARMRLLSTSYADFEHQIREQMTEMFGVAGFDARRDIAGIVLNRWGHAYCAPQPGFFFGRDGNPPPSDVIRQPHGRIAFGHSELNGLMSMASGMKEGHRAVTQAMAML